MSIGRLKILLQIEWMKTWSRLNIVFTMVVFLLVLMQVAFIVPLNIGEFTNHVPVDVVAIHVNRYTNNIAFTFIPVLILINVGYEFEYGIVQRCLISGLRRRDYYMGKLVQLCIFSFLCLLLAIVFVMLSAVIYESAVYWDIKKLAMYFLVSICLGSLSLMMVMILKKRFYALGTFILYVLLENTINTVLSEPILLPVQSCIQLLREGIYDWPQFIMASIYTVSFVAAGYVVFRKSDLK